MSQWGGAAHLQKQPPSTTASPAPASPAPQQSSFQQSATALDMFNSERASPSPHHQRNRSESRPSSRPMSMIQTYQPPVMDISADTLPELQRIFTFLNSHSNKLYQEGYFLKFHDTDARMLSLRCTRPGSTDSMQVAALLQTANGRSILSSSSAPFSHCGMPATWTTPAATRRCSPPSST
jgi:hypothetical protein